VYFHSLRISSPLDFVRLRRTNHLRTRKRELCKIKLDRVECTCPSRLSETFPKRNRLVISLHLCVFARRFLFSTFFALRFFSYLFSGAKGFAPFSRVGSVSLIYPDSERIETKKARFVSILRTNRHRETSWFLLYVRANHRRFYDR